MKIKIIGVIIVSMLTIAALPVTRDLSHWGWALYHDQTLSYESYLKTWPDGHKVLEAQKKYDEYGWAEVNTTNTIQGFEQYIQLHSKSKHVSEAKNNIDSLHWQLATNTDTIKAYQKYSLISPQGKHIKEAEKKVTELRANDERFNTALNTGTEASLKKFLDDYPGHRMANQAQLFLNDIASYREIFDLLKEKKIEIKTKGDGISSVSLSVRKLVPHTVSVRIPVGSYFVSTKRSTQNMITTAEKKIKITEEGWQRIAIPAACANIRRAIPGDDDTFTVKRSPHQADLARLMPTVESSAVSYPTLQAAVWIVTDNANYSDLGRLRKGYGSNSTRTIKLNEVATALYLIGKSGIPVENKRAWRSRVWYFYGARNKEVSDFFGQRDKKLLADRIEMQAKAQERLAKYIPDPDLNASKLQASILITPLSVDRGAEAGWIYQWLIKQGHEVKINLYDWPRADWQGPVLQYENANKKQVYAMARVLSLALGREVKPDKTAYWNDGPPRRISVDYVH